MMRLGLLALSGLVALAFVAPALATDAVLVQTHRLAGSELPYSALPILDLSNEIEGFLYFDTTRRVRIDMFDADTTIDVRFEHGLHSAVMSRLGDTLVAYVAFGTYDPHLARIGIAADQLSVENIAVDYFDSYLDYRNGFGSSGLLYMHLSLASSRLIPNTVDFSTIMGFQEYRQTIGEFAEHVATSICYTSDLSAHHRKSPCKSMTALDVDNDGQIEWIALNSKYHSFLPVHELDIIKDEYTSVSVSRDDETIWHSPLFEGTNSYEIVIGDFAPNAPGDEFIYWGRTADLAGIRTEAERHIACYRLDGDSLVTLWYLPVDHYFRLYHVYYPGHALVAKVLGAFILVDYETGAIRDSVYLDRYIDFYKFFEAGPSPQSLYMLGHLRSAHDSIVIYQFDTPTDVDNSTDPILPNMFSLHQNYPNPFNPSTTISYSLPERSHVTLSVYNILGQRVATLDNEEKPAGLHEAFFDPRDLASGIYLYRLTANGYSETRKMTLVK